MKKIYVIADKLNLRSNPGINKNPIGMLSKNEIVEALQFSNDYSWVKIRRGNGEEGWSSYKYFLGVPEIDKITPDDFPWLKIAFGEYGTAELAGNMTNQRISQFLKSCELSLDKIDENSDETSWCSAFANWCMEMAGYTGTNSAWALDWWNWGKAAEPVKGAITVFKRFVVVNGVKNTFGHVGFYLGKDPENSNNVLIIGGNQGNMVKMSSYPIKSKGYELLGYKLPG